MRAMPCQISECTSEGLNRLARMDENTFPLLAFLPTCPQGICDEQMEVGGKGKELLLITSTVFCGLFELGWLVYRRNR